MTSSAQELSRVIYVVWNLAWNAGIVLGKHRII